MAYTPENNPYIPGDPYSYDLKWVVTNIKDLIANYTGQIDELKAFIMDYINSLDLSPIVAAQIQEMYDNGDFDAMLAQFITDNKVVLVDTDQSGIFTETEKATGRKNLGASAYNKNLLDNSFFQINQRVFSNGSTTNPVIFPADRWEFTRGATSNTSSGIDIAWDGVTGSDAELKQKIDSTLYAELANKTVTISIMFSDGSVYSKSGTYNSTGVVLAETNFTLAVYGGSTNQVRVNTTSTAAITIRAVKLELGSISTLAYDAPPNYAEELAKCQRYFQRISSPAGGFVPFTAIGYSNSTTSIRFAVGLPVTMRANPSIAHTLIMQAIGDGTTADVTALSFIRLYENSVSLEATISGTLTINQIYCLNGRQGYIDLSADL